jgi:hypothetical protein
MGYVRVIYEKYSLLILSSFHITPPLFVKKREQKISTLLSCNHKKFLTK